MNATVLKSRFKVEGMDSASCANKIDIIARGVDGVVDVSVSMAAGTMRIEHRPEADMAKLAKRVRSLGYKVAPIALAQAND